MLHNLRFASVMLHSRMTTASVKTKAVTTTAYTQMLTEETGESFVTLAKEETNLCKLPSDGYCDDHNNLKQLMCLNCEIWICGVCVALKHKSCKTFQIDDVLKEVKQRVYEKLTEVEETQCDRSDSFDKFHNLLKSFHQYRCMDCGSWICSHCSTCYAQGRIQCLTLLSELTDIEVKQNLSQQVDAQVEAQVVRSKNLDKFQGTLKRIRNILKVEVQPFQLEVNRKVVEFRALGKYMEELQLLKAARNEICRDLIHYENLVAKSLNIEEFSKAHCKLENILQQASRLEGDQTVPKWLQQFLTLEDMKEWSKNNTLYALRDHQGISQYGKIFVKGNRILIHCFHCQRPDGNPIFFTFRDILLASEESSELPQEAFLQLGDETTIFGDVVIATDGHTPRALNFLLQCSGVKGCSYKGSRIFNWFESIGTTSSESSGRFTKGIKDGGVYEARAKKGLVIGWDAGWNNCMSGFRIWMKDDPSETLTSKFGFVKEGLNVCDMLCETGKLIYIKTCGLVI